MSGVNFNDYLCTPYSMVSYPSMGMPNFAGAATQQELFMQQRYLQDRAIYDKNKQKEKNRTKAVVGVGVGLATIALGVLYFKNPARRAKAMAQLNRGWEALKGLFRRGPKPPVGPSKPPVPPTVVVPPKPPVTPVTSAVTTIIPPSSTTVATTVKPSVTKPVAGLLEYKPKPTAGKKPTIAGLLGYKPKPGEIAGPEYWLGIKPGVKPPVKPAAAVVTDSVKPVPVKIPKPLTGIKAIRAEVAKLDKYRSTYAEVDALARRAGVKLRPVKPGTNPIEAMEKYINQLKKGVAPKPRLVKYPKVVPTRWVLGNDGEPILEIVGKVKPPVKPSSAAKAKAIAKAASSYTPPNFGDYCLMQGNC